MSWESRNLNLAAPFYTFLHSSYIKSLNPLKFSEIFLEYLFIKALSAYWIHSGVVQKTIYTC